MDLASFTANYPESRIVIEASEQWFLVEIDPWNALQIERGNTLSDLQLHIEDLDRLDVKEQVELQEALGGNRFTAYKAPPLQDDEN